MFKTPGFALRGLPHYARRKQGGKQHMASLAEISGNDHVLARQAAILNTPPTEERMMANAIRALAIDAVEAAKCGHPGMPMGMADAATVLWKRFQKFDAADAGWWDRDRFVLSAGHGSMLLYALLHLTGHEGMGIEVLKQFRQPPGIPGASSY